MITRRGADALGMGKEIGTLSPGKYADVVLFPATDTQDPLTEVMRTAPQPQAVWLAGNPIQTAASFASPPANPGGVPYE
jgi:imidazolonepropionase-like amidohydrolase